MHNGVTEATCAKPTKSGARSNKPLIRRITSYSERLHPVEVRPLVVFKYPDAKIVINGGKVILDGGVIHNGHILNKGTLIVKNGGSISMRYGDEYVHNPENMEILNNGKLPFPISLNLEKGSFVPYK